MDKDFMKFDISQPLEEAWVKLRAAKKSAAPVFDQGRLAGMLDTENVAEFLMISEAKSR
jgi:predicted transcriptional regulator